MSTTSLIFSIIALMVGLFSFLPELRLTHWTVRMFDFIRFQLWGLKIILFILMLNFTDLDLPLVQISLFALVIAFAYQSWIMAPYLAINRIMGRPESRQHSIKLISINVLQKNRNYKKVIDLIKEERADLILIMESNSAWGKALEQIEKDYPQHHKIPLENRYGMHLYTNLKLIKSESHFLISEERPAIKSYLEDKAGNEFIFWGIHPPPPSPTELPTSRQKDAELTKLAKMIREEQAMTVVAGDFNSVCWSLTSRRFAKISLLRDARFRNGIHPSFPVRPKFFRFPLDLLFNSRGIAINEIKTLKDIGSDHLPIYSEFTIESNQAKPKEDLPIDLKEESKEVIEEGNKAIKEEDA